MEDGEKFSGRVVEVVEVGLGGLMGTGASVVLLYLPQNSMLASLVGSWARRSGRNVRRRAARGRARGVIFVLIIIGGLFFIGCRDEYCNCNSF